MSIYLADYKHETKKNSQKPEHTSTKNIMINATKPKNGTQKQRAQRDGAGGRKELLGGNQSKYVSCSCGPVGCAFP